MFNRLFLRTVIFAVMTAFAFVFVELCVRLGRNDSLPIAAAFPEIVRFLVAVAVLAWAEISIKWISVIISPKIDIQEAAIVAEMNNSGAAYLVHQMVWLGRLTAFLCLYLVQ